MPKTLEEWEDEKFDFSKAKRVDPKRVDPNPKVMISLRLEPKLLLSLRKEAERVGIPYQTLIHSLLHRFVNGELIDKSEARKLVKQKS